MRLMLTILLTITVIWCGYWFVGSSALRSGVAGWFDARSAEGQVARYADISVAGFPNRFDLTLDDVTLGDSAAGLEWSAPFFQILALSYKPNHVIAVWPQSQEIRMPSGAYKIDSARMRASLEVGASADLPLEKTTLKVDDLRIDGPAGDTLRADTAVLAIERGAEDRRYRLGISTTGLALPAQLLGRLDGAAAETMDIRRIDAIVSFDAPLDRHALRGTPPKPTQIKLSGSEATWGDVRAAVWGTLDIGADGRPEGMLTMELQRWRRLLDLAEAAGVILPDMRADAERALSVMAQASGNDDTLKLPLKFERGRVWLGPLAIADAPVLQLR